MQYLINLLGRYRFNWTDLLSIYLFSDLVQKGQWIVALAVLMVGTVLSVALHRHAED